MKSGAVAAAAMLVIAVASGCRDQGANGPSAGCGGGTTTQTITVDGRQRTYLLTLPITAATTPAPIVFDFPGLGESAKEEAAYSHLGEQAAARGWIGVTPQASGAAWTIPPLPGPNDVNFFSAMVADIVASHCGDVTRVFAAGISNGASFAGALACSSGVRLAGVGMVAGINAYAQCKTQPPLRVIGFNGTADPIVPFNGGTIFGGADQQGGGIVPPAMTALAGWGERNHCSGSPTTTDIASDVELMSIDGCQAATRLYVLVGGGHTWPGAAPVAEKALGPTNSHVSATQLILDFIAG